LFNILFGGFNILIIFILSFYQKHIEMKKKLHYSQDDVFILFVQHMQTQTYLIQKLVEILEQLARNNSPRKNTMDASELKREYNLSDSTIRRLRINGEIIFQKKGGKYFYDRRSFENWINRRNNP